MTEGDVVQLPVAVGQPRTRMTGKERREQLIAVGRRVFAERGYEAASIEDIAERAKVSKPVVYEHFGGKEGLGDSGVAEKDVVDAQPGFFAVLCPGKAESPGGVGLGVAVDEQGGESFEGDGSS